MEGSEESKVSGSEDSGRILAAISGIGVKVTKHVDERVEGLRNTMSGRFDTLNDTVTDLRVAFSETKTAQRAHGREIGELKDASKKTAADLAVMTAATLPQMIKEHQHDCEATRAKLAAQSSTPPGAPTSDPVQQRQSASWTVVRFLLPYIIAAILSFLLGSGITIAVTAGGADAVPTLKFSHQKPAPPGASAQE